MCKTANLEFKGKDKILSCQRQSSLLQRHKGENKDLAWSLSPKWKTEVVRKASGRCPEDKAQIERGFLGSMAFITQNHLLVLKIFEDS